MEAQDPVPSSDPSPADAPAAPRTDAAAQDPGIPSTGKVWLEHWLVGEILPGERPYTIWKAVHRSDNIPAWIVAARAKNSKDVEPWDRLGLCESERLVRPLDAKIVEDRRFEAYSVPDGPTLAEVIARKDPKPSLEFITGLVRDVADALEALYANDLAHCHLDPASIFCVNNGKKWTFQVSGLDGMVCTDRPGLLDIDVDPFYAPPECAGLFKHKGGVGLRAWDWWSLGRIVQELLLGRHIQEHMLDHTATRSAQEDREFAEKMLLERATIETRAGGMEHMPGQEKRLDLLLRGLLTGSRDARWGLEEAKRWVAGESPKDRYDLPNDERLFIYKGKAHTVPETAEVLRSTENWEDAKRQLVDKDSPDTLVHFVNQHPNLAHYAKKISDGMAIIMSSDLRKYQMPVKTDLALAVTLTKLSGTQLYWRGRKMDAANIREMLDGDKTGEILNYVQAFASGIILTNLEKDDIEAFRTLSESSRLAQRAIQRCTEHGWMKIAGPASIAQIWRMSFDSPSVWLEARQKLQAKYACSTLKEVQDIYQSQRLTPEESLLIAWMQPLADSFGFVEHQYWEAQQVGEITKKGRKLANALFWLRLGSVIHYGKVWLGNPVWIVPAWVVLGVLVAFAWPGPDSLPYCFVGLSLALLIRLSMKWLIQPFIDIYAPGASWGFLDGEKRCLREAQQDGDSVPEAGSLLLQLRAVNERLSKLTHAEVRPLPVPEPSHLMELMLLAVMGWALLVAPATLASVKIVRSGNPWTRFVDAWTPDEEKNLEWLPPPPEVKIDFPYEKPKHARPVILLGTEEASKLQVKVARRRGAYYTQDYRPQDIGCPVLVPLPTVRGNSFMVYDPRSDEVSGTRILFLKSTPARRTFVAIDKDMVWVPNY